MVGVSRSVGATPAAVGGGRDIFPFDGVSWIFVGGGGMGDGKGRRYRRRRGRRIGGRCLLGWTRGSLLESLDVVW